MAEKENQIQKSRIDYGGQKHKWANELNRFVLQTKRDFINYFDCLKIAVMLKNYDSWYNYDVKKYAKGLQEGLDFYAPFTERLQLYLADTKRKYKMYYAFTIVNDTIQKDLKKNECYKFTSFYFDWIDDLKELLKINARSGKYYNFLYPALYDPRTFEDKTEDDVINDIKTNLNGIDITSILEKNSIDEADWEEETKTNLEANKRVQELVKLGAF